ncbi:thiolase family protein, partial [bacterium]|nr:thiolase family protein [bacterium]
MKDVVIVSGVRTPVGRYMGGLKTVEAYELAEKVLAESIRRVGLEPEQIDEVVLGQSYQNGEYVNIARMALLRAGWPETVTGLTVDQRCCSGLESVRLASALIQSGQAEIIVAGGVESMSNAEFYLPGSMKWGIGGQKGMPRGHGDLSIWGLPFYDRIQRARVMSQPEERYGVLPSMMSWAETGARVENISREACDQWALDSHRKACAAVEAGKFKDEILPIEIALPKGKTEIMDRDENPRPDTSLESLTKLKPVLGGVCTAGNSSTENDGAAAVVIMSAEKAAQLNLKPLAIIRSVMVAGASPERAYETVPAAVNKALKASGLALGQMDLIEIQEAFAAQVLADLKEMGIGPEGYGKINVNGSGISLGHPIAATGTRVLVTLLQEMQRSDV